MAVPDTHLCLEKTLDDEQLPPSNLQQPEFGSGPLSLALHKSKFWRTGTKLRVKFSGGGSKFVRERVAYYAQQWEPYANIDFRFVADDDPDAEIRVSFTPDGNSWSYVGTDNLRIQKDKPTMNFGWFNDQTAENEFSRTTIHEFGHALGCVHEHQSPKANIDWDLDKLYARFAAQGWDKAKVDAQIVNRLTTAQAEATLFDINSIMMYFFPGELVKSRVGSPVNYVLSTTDKAMISTIYPFQIRDTGAYSTLTDRPWYPPVAMNAKQISFNPTYVNPPRVVVGLAGLDMYQATNQRIKVYPDRITDSNFVVHADSWADTQLYSADTTWVEAEDTDFEFQMGTFDTLSLHPWDKPQQKNEARINFSTPYDEAPNVMVWISGFDIAAGHNFRLAVSADAIDKAGFTIHLDTWADCVLYAANASWIAYPKKKAGVLSGSDSTYAYRPWYPAQEKNGRKVTFPKGAFDKTPKVFAALSLIDFDSAKNMRVKSFVDAVSADGFTWHGDSWADTLCYGVGVSWIAFG
jgi:hypothetical protein